MQVGGGQSVSVMTKVGGTSCRHLGMRVGLVLSCMVEVEMVRQWLDHLTRICLLWLGGVYQPCTNFDYIRWMAARRKKNSEKNSGTLK